MPEMVLGVEVGIWFLLFVAIEIAMFDWLLHKFNYPMITESLRKLSIFLKCFITGIVGAIIGHLFWR